MPGPSGLAAAPGVTRAEVGSAETGMSGEASGDVVAATATGVPAPPDGLPAGVAGGATTRAVAVGCGVALVSRVGRIRPIIGDPLDSGVADRVAARSTATWVRTLGPIVITSSLGCELDRVKTSASRRLASNAPTAINAFVRFNMSSRSRHGRRPALGVRSGKRVPPARIDSCAGADFTPGDGKSAGDMTPNA